jgi:hypothetical protein
LLPAIIVLGIWAFIFLIALFLFFLDRLLLYFPKSKREEKIKQRELLNALEAYAERVCPERK